MSRRQYNITESLNRILRSFKGLTQNDEPGTLAGEVLSDNQAYSDLAELLNDSLPGEILLLPTALKNAVASAGFAITGSASSSNLDIVTGTSVVADNATALVIGSGITVAVSGSVVYLNNALGVTVPTVFVPTLTQGVAVAITSNDSRYQIVGKMCMVHVSLAANAAGTEGQPVVVGNLPSSAFLGGNAVGSGVILDQGTAYYVGTVHGAGVTTAALISHLEGDLVGADPSFALAAGDSIDFFLMYQVA